MVHINRKATEITLLYLLDRLHCLCDLSDFIGIKCHIEHILFSEVLIPM